ncbi:MAG: hypothetical protein K0Q95_2021 [Bacteroidota bacterium]|jgi:hypothetical protein|nr:hypothetical protein [Bacteroidota bacterium]
MIVLKGKSGCVKNALIDCLFISAKVIIFKIKNAFPKYQKGVY